MRRLKDKFIKLLRWSEKYTKTDMVYLAKGGFWLTLSKIISTFSGFALAVIFANFLSQEVFGTYKYILSLISIVTIPTLFGMSASLIQTVARGNDGAFYPALKTRIKWGFLGSLASLVIALYYYHKSEAILTTAFLIVAVFIPFLDSFTLYFSFLNGKKRFKEMSKYDALIKVCSVISMSLAAFLTDSVLWVIFTYLFSNTSLRIFFSWWTMKKFKENDDYDSGMIGYGKHLSLMGVITQVAEQFDKVLLFNFLGPVRLAVYSFALSPILESRTMINTISDMALPKLSENEMDVLKKTLPAKVFKFTGLLAVGVGLYVLLAPFFYKLLFPQYMDSVIYSRFFALSLIFYPSSIFQQALVAQAKKKELYIVRFAAPCVRILLLLVLLPLFGLWGAVVALVLAQVFGFILNYYFFKTVN